MNDFDPMQYGILTSQVNTLEREVRELRSDIRDLLALANKSKGGFWVGMTISAAIGSIVTLAIDLFKH
jgi:hypothetical protein